MEFEKGMRIVILAGWCDEGKTGIVLGDPVEGRDRDDWVPVLWDDADDPDFFKGEGLGICKIRPLGEQTIYFPCKNFKRDTTCHFCTWAKCGKEQCQITLMFDKGVHP